MGCSIETYRLRIGINNLKTKKLTSYKQHNTNKNNNKKETHRTVLIIILTLTALIPNTHYNTETKQQKPTYKKW